MVLAWAIYSGIPLIAMQYNIIILIAQLHVLYKQRRIQDFHLRGEGGAKDYMRVRTPQARSPKFFTARGFNALLCYLSFIFKHSDTTWDKKKQTQSIKF